MLINNDTIIKDTDPLIREKSELVSLPLSKEDETLLRDMLQYVKDSTDEEKAAKFNPAYLESGEGCLSVENEHQGYVVRNARVTIRAFDLVQNQDVEIRARGYIAIVLQHELDHMDGILFYDHINKKEPNKPIEGALVLQ